MRVLMVEFDGVGGISTYADGLCLGLAQNGAAVTMLTSPLWSDPPRPFGVRKHLLPALLPSATHWPAMRWAADRIARFLINSLRVRRFARRFRPDVVHLQGGTPMFDQFLLKSLARRMPLVLTVHDVKPHVKKFFRSRWVMRRYYRRFHRFIVHFADGRRQMVDDWNLPGDRIDVIPHGLVPLPARPEMAEARRQLKLPADAGIVLFFGSIRADKGISVLVPACEDLFRRRPDALLVIAGNTPRRGDFDPHAARIAQAGISSRTRTFIRFIEENEVDTFFAAADVVVLPYRRFESQSGVLLRAYSHEKPVVASALGAMGEAVKADGVGIAVAPGDPHALADALAEVLDRSEAFVAQYGQKVREKYDQRRIGELTIRCYEKAIAAFH